MDCARCNEPLFPNARFCGSCGAPVPAAKQASTEDDKDFGDKATRVVDASALVSGLRSTSRTTAPPAPSDADGFEAQATVADPNALREALQMMRHPTSVVTGVARETLEETLARAAAEVAEADPVFGGPALAKPAPAEQSATAAAQIQSSTKAARLLTRPAPHTPDPAVAPSVETARAVPPTAAAPLPTRSPATARASTQPPSAARAVIAPAPSQPQHSTQRAAAPAAPAQAAVSSPEHSRARAAAPAAPAQAAVSSTEHSKPRAAAPQRQATGSGVRATGQRPAASRPKGVQRSRRFPWVVAVGTAVAVVVLGSAVLFATGLIHL